MARMPGAQWLGEHSPQIPMTRYDVVCVHTIVGYAPAHAAHFSVKADGTILQSRDTRFRSAANLDGNYRVLAVENEDHGRAFGAWSGSDVPALTDAQVLANARILAWAHEVHGVPLQLCPDSRTESRGLAYHRQGIDGNFGTYRYPGRVQGGEVWTKSFGKVCPGDRRISQLPAILAAARGQEDDMPLSTEDIDKVADAVVDRVLKSADGNSVGRVLGFQFHGQRAIIAALSALAESQDDTVRAAVQEALADADLLTAGDVVEVDINVKQNGA